MSQDVVRKPTLKDVPGILKLIQHYAERKFLLPLTSTQVAERLRDFFICERDGRIVGCGALHLWSDLAEIRSLAVAEDYWRQRIGTILLTACVDEARTLGVRTVFALTYQPDFFERIGFRRVSKDMFPHKIWMDCVNCPQFPNCGETALVLDLGQAASTT